MILTCNTPPPPPPPPQCITNVLLSLSCLEKFGKYFDLNFNRALQ